MIERSQCWTLALLRNLAKRQLRIFETIDTANSSKVSFINSTKPLPTGTLSALGTQTLRF